MLDTNADHYKIIAIVQHYGMIVEVISFTEGGIEVLVRDGDDDDIIIYQSNHDFVTTGFAMSHALSLLIDPPKRRLKDA